MKLEVSCIELSTGTLWLPVVLEKVLSMGSLDALAPESKQEEPSLVFF